MNGQIVFSWNYGKANIDHVGIFSLFSLFHFGSNILYVALIYYIHAAKPCPLPINFNHWTNISMENIVRITIFIAGIHWPTNSFVKISRTWMKQNENKWKTIFILFQINWQYTYIYCSICRRYWIVALTQTRNSNCIEYWMLNAIVNRLLFQLKIFERLFVIRCHLIDSSACSWNDVLNILMYNV